MPALYLFGRRTLLAGDDLQLPSLAWGCVSAAQLFVLVPYSSYAVVNLLLTASTSSSSSSPGGYAEVNVDAGGMTTGISAAGRRRWRRLVDDDVDDYRAEACYDATSGYLDLFFPHILLAYLIGVALCSAISLRYERRIFEVSSRGTPTTGARLRAPLGKLIETKMTSLAGINASLLLFGLWAALSRGTGTRYGECLPPSWWMSYASLLLSQATQSLVAFATLFSLRGVPPVKSSSPTGYGVMTTETNDGGTSDDDPYRRDFDYDGDGNGGGDHRRGIRDVHGNSAHHHHIAEEMWQARCEGCCRILAVSTCFLFGGRGIVSHAAERGMGGNGGGGGGVGGGHKFYGDIARALADYFADFDDPGEEGGLDVVPSDVGLGFVMLRHVQAQRRMIARRDALSQLRPRSRRGGATDRWRGSGGPPPTPSTRSSSAAREADVTSSSSSSSMDDGTTLLFRRSLSGGEGGTEQPILSPASSRTDDEEAYGSFSRAVLSPSNPDDYALIEEGARFARHQLAIYTWMLYYFDYPVSGTFRLIGRKLRSKIKCADPTTTRPALEDSSGIPDGIDHRETTIVVGDNFLRLHEASLLAHAGLEMSDVAYASFEAGGFYETPYCIVIDRRWRSVVLSIRGSLTLEDCVVDVLLDPCPLDALGEKYGFSGGGQYCHGGVLECTNWLHADLMRHKVLQKLLLGDNAEYPDYTLRIVGHSLGAGIGVILSLMLRNTYPSLRCICYSPPGGLLTWGLATQCSEFVNSFVLDSDIVPRLSVDNMERLRDEVLRLIARVKLSKYEIARRIFWHGVCGDVDPGDADFSLQMTEDMLHAPDRVPDSDFSRQLRRFESMQRERRSSRGLVRSISLYPPGRITHLVKTGQIEGCLHGVAGFVTCGASNAGSEYTPVRKENDDFNEIEISPTLWTDHFPNRVCYEMERIAKSFGIDTTLGSPQ